MRIAGAWMALWLCAFSAGASDVEPLATRPITLRRGAVELTVNGIYTNWSGSAFAVSTGSFSGETLALGVDFGVSDRVQFGVATAMPIEPGAAFGSVLASVAVALDQRSAVRLDAGYENFGVNGGNFLADTHTDRYFSGVGAGVRLPIGPMLSFVSGRTGAVQLGNFMNIGDRGIGTYFGASFFTEGGADFFVLSGGNNGSPTNIGINLPAGLLLQPDPHFALTLQTGYSVDISIPSGGGDAAALHFIPVGLEAVVSPFAALDIGSRLFIDGYVARSGGAGGTTPGYLDLRALLLWIRVRV